MPRVSVALITIVMLVAACGGDAPPAATPTPGSDATPGAQPTPDGPPPNGSTDYLTTDDIAAAVAALEAQGSWTFESTFYLEGYDEATSVSGTERRASEEARDTTHVNTLGEYHYIRIGDDVWTDVGAGFAHALASESPNLLAQYEPLHLAGVLDRTTGWRRGVEYDLVGTETVNGVSAVHYSLNEFDRETLTERSDLEPEQWAGDVWVAADGGYLVRFVWGPQTAETAHAAPFGVAYDVTSVGCSCPVESPE